MTWLPHVTVAAVIHKDGKFLMVEEFSKDTDKKNVRVINQPAGHLEEDETVFQALTRETFEETGWKVKPEAILGIHLYKAENEVTYLRINFLATPLHEKKHAVLDDDIIRTHWMTHEEIKAKKEILRSELVLEAVELYYSGPRYPLSLLNSTFYQKK
ncbi:MAG: NUDIX hydrolase [Cellvibrionaceae bacterium]